MTYCHLFYLDIWIIFRIFKGGWVGTVYQRFKKNKKKVVKYLDFSAFIRILDL